MNEQNSKKSFIIKLIVVLLSIAFIITAGVIAMRREKLQEEAKEAEASAAEAAEAAKYDTIDAENALIQALVPTIPDPVSYNGLTKRDCETAVKDGRMIKLSSSNGSSVYINNYRDDELLKEAVETEDDFKTWLYTGYAVFDVDKDKVRSLYSEALEQFISYLRDTEGISMQTYLNNSGVSADEYMNEQIQVAYQYYCDLEMSEAMLTDTIGDISDEEITEFAASQGYDSTDEFIKEYGRYSILYYLRPQKLLQYVDQRLEEIK